MRSKRGQCLLDPYREGGLLGRTRGSTSLPGSVFESCDGFPGWCNDFSGLRRGFSVVPCSGSGSRCLGVRRGFAVHSVVDSRGFVVDRLADLWNPLISVGSYCYRNTQRCGSGGLGHRTTALLSNSM